MVSTKANRKAFIDSVEAYMKYVSSRSLFISKLSALNCPSGDKY